MTSVFITRTGTKYHATSSCPSFDDAEREHGHDIRRWEVALGGLTQTPCQRCWHLEPSWGGWEQLAHRIERDPDSGLAEAAFVRHVLAQLPGLRPADVVPQYETRVRGRNYRIDFVIDRPGSERIAVEIDGYDKAPGTASPQDVRRQVDQRRAELREAGWRVINLSNQQVLSASDEAVREVAAELRDAQGRLEAQSQPTRREDTEQPSAETSFAVSGARTGPARYVLATLAAVGIGAVAWMFMTTGSDGEMLTPVGQDCPGEAPIKGNVSADDQKIFHSPGWRYYEATRPEQCFSDESAAGQAGYRPSQVR